MTINGFHGTRITEALNEAKTFLDSVENPLRMLGLNFGISK